MRRLLVLAILAGLLSVPAAAFAHHRPTSYCSRTGDICQSTTRVDGVRSLRISLFAKYFGRYDLCVTGPMSTTCKTFRIKAMPNGLFGSKVKWAERFPDEGPGAYTVRWFSRPGGAKVGRTLGFHEAA